MNIPSPRFVVLDRDGTIIVERHYLSDYRLVELLPGVAEGLRLMKKMGLGLVVVTNQSGLGRGYFSREQLKQIHDRMTEMLALEKVVLDGIFICPHTPSENCFCRKPREGLIEQAAASFGFTASASFVIGDKPCDIELGQRVGAQTILVRTGYGAQVESENSTDPDYVVDDLRDAARIIKEKLVS